MFGPLVMAATVLLILSTSPAKSLAAPASDTPAPQSLAPQQEKTPQLADEITRRIRRLGSGLIHFPNLRPAEVVGDVC